MIKVRATDKYENGLSDKKVEDNELGYVPKEGEIFEVTEERFNKLNGNNIYGLVFVEKVEEEKKEEKKPKTETKKKTSKKKISDNNS